MLLNILIPIVWDAYHKALETNSADILFWEIRLELAIQALLISMSNSNKDSWMNSQWSCLAEKFKSKHEVENALTCSMLLLSRFISALLMLVWVILGLLTAGILWPPQVREDVWNQLKSVRAFFSLRMRMPSLWSFLTKIYEDKSNDKCFDTRASRRILLLLCRLIFPLIIHFWLTLGLITLGLLGPPLNTESFYSIAEIWNGGTSEIAATDENIQELDKMIKKLGEMRGEREKAQLGDNKKEMIIKINELIGGASALLAVVCRQNAR